MDGEEVERGVLPERLAVFCAGVPTGAEVVPADVAAVSWLWELALCPPAGAAEPEGDGEGPTDGEADAGGVPESEDSCRERFRGDVSALSEVCWIKAAAAAAAAAVAASSGEATGLVRSGQYLAWWLFVFLQVTQIGASLQWARVWEALLQ